MTDKAVTKRKSTNNDIQNTILSNTNPTKTGVNSVALCGYEHLAQNVTSAVYSCNKSGDRS
jgi:hypothetical protein